MVTGAVVLHMGLGQSAAVEHGHEGVLRLDGSAADGVELAGVVDAVGKAPFGQESFAVQTPVFGRLVEVELAAAHHVIAGRLQQSR
jgi:hypothetical protein